MAKPPSGQDTGDVSAFDKGAVIFKKGDTSRDLYVIQEGYVELMDASGKQVLVRLLSGEFFGELAALESQPRECSARAGTGCKLLKVSPADLEGLLADPEIAAQMLRRLSRRLSAMLTPEEGATKPVSATPKKSTPLPTPQVAAGGGTMRLVHPGTGKEFPLPPAGEALVGRADPRSSFTPDVELSSVDAQRSLSRRHARIVMREGGAFVSEETRVTNGTFVNGKRVNPGEAVRIKDGDKVRFGLVETVFRAE